MKARFEIPSDASPRSGHLLHLSGEASLDQAVEVRRILLEALAESGELTIGLEEITAADLSFLQILLAARQTAVEQSKNLTLAGPGPSTALKELGICAGFEEPGKRWLEIPIKEPVA